MIPIYGKPRPEQHYALRPGAYAILQRDEMVLLTHQKEPEPEFQLPGGGIDTGESMIGALHREILEETGWRVSSPRRLGAFRRFVYMPEYDLWAEKLCHVFLARPVVRHGPPEEEGHTAVWVPLNIAPDIIADPGASAFARRLTRVRARP